MAALSEIRDFLWPEQAERDQGFQAEIERLGRRGLRVIGAVQIVMPVLGTLFHFVIAQKPWLAFNPGPVVLSIALGMVTRWSADTLWGSRQARIVAMCSGLGSMALETWSELHLISIGLRQQTSGGVGVLVVLLVGLAVLPIKPWHTCVLGAGCSAVYLQWTAYAVRHGWIAESALNDLEFVSLPLMVLLCTALAGVSYQRIHSTYLSHQRALNAAEELRHSESRNLIAENAASMGRLAAAVSHELNSPLGAIRSAAETMLLLLAYKAT